ncbi:GntR family transcriptional regulator [Undibacterium sp. TJN25]|uniref:GntR family transcriptional regulator n=1 Tax=Undibacterium sp. TJN25 TaxID=3413056 RepID=UPI003BF0DDB7
MSDISFDVAANNGSLTVSIYKRLQADVLAGRLAPGDKLKIHDLSEQMDVSPGVVREALSRLASESIVVASPQRGFRVAPISAEDVRDLTQARIEIERSCLRRSLTNGDVAWEAAILAALHRLSHTPHEAADLSEPWADTHAQFHKSLVDACDSKWLLKVREQLFVQAERYRRINTRLSADIRDLRAEHEEIAKLAISRDVERTCEMMEHHLKLTETLTLQMLGAK